MERLRKLWEKYVVGLYLGHAECFDCNLLDCRGCNALQDRNFKGILIVEDSTIFRQLLRDTLHQQFPSVEICEAANGEEALAQIETFHPTVIFMDIRLPGENGLELTQKVKARDPNIAVIILTAYDLPEYREYSSRYADYFLSKDSSTAENVFTLVESILPTRAHSRVHSFN